MMSWLSRMTITLVTLVMVAGAAGLAPEVAAQERAPVVIAVGEAEYEVGWSGQYDYSTLSVDVPAPIIVGEDLPYYEQPSVHEAVVLTNFVIGVRAATSAYFADLIATCNSEAAEAEISCDDPESESCEEYIEQEREQVRLLCLGNRSVPPDIDAGWTIMSDLSSYLISESAVLGENIAGEIQLAEDIAANMLEGGPAPPYDDGGMDENPWSVPGVITIGVTTGGAQDIGYIRTLVEVGFVPLPFHLAADGLYSEHDLPLAAPPCEKLLCLSAAVGAAKAFDNGENSYFIHFGFSTNITTSGFERAPLNLALVIDKSGSMHDPIDSSGISKMDAVKSALLQLVENLDPRDHLSIITFDHHAESLLRHEPASNPQAIREIIESIQAGGSTCIECGLELGFRTVAAYAEPSWFVLDRVVLFTDALPNTGQTGESAFLDMAHEYADQGIGLTTFGVGLNFGQELVLALSEVPGSNYFFLESAERMEEIFTLEFDYLVSPIAFNLHVELAPAAGFSLRDVFGIETWSVGEGITFDVPTLFLSQRSGAIVLQLSGRKPRSGGLRW
jgi:Ca-activated chloride channel family protein